MLYYELFFDTKMKDCWHLKEPRDGHGCLVDSWHFTMAKRYDGNKDLTIKLQYPGPELDITFNAFGLLIARHDLSEKLHQIDEMAIQSIPVAIEGSENRFDILNILNEIDCVDESRAKFKKWTMEDSRPDLAGDFHYIEKLVLRTDVLYPFSIFRVARHSTTIIIKRGLKEFFDRLAVTGIECRPLT